MLDKNANIVLISEMKLDDSFPMAHFKIAVTTPYKSGRNNKGGDHLFYIWEEKKLFELRSIKEKQTGFEI